MRARIIVGAHGRHPEPRGQSRLGWLDGRIPQHLRERIVIYPTRRQRQIMFLMGHGGSRAEIARFLGISPTTVQRHLRLLRIAYGKIGVPSTGIYAMLYRRGHLRDPGLFDAPAWEAAPPHVSVD